MAELSTRNARTLIAIKEAAKGDGFRPIPSQHLLEVDFPNVRGTTCKINKRTVDKLVKDGLLVVKGRWTAYRNPEAKFTTEGKKALKYAKNVFKQYLEDCQENEERSLRWKKERNEQAIASNKETLAVEKKVLGCNLKESFNFRDLPIEIEGVKCEVSLYRYLERTEDDGYQYHTRSRQGRVYSFSLDTKDLNAQEVKKLMDYFRVALRDGKLNYKRTRKN